MADKSAIEWTDATWNPIVGCSIVSPGCTNCYAMKMAARIERMHEGRTHYAGTTKQSKAGAAWSDKVAQAPEHILTQPLRWKRGRRIFVNSMGDLFHESILDEWIDRVFAVMALCPQHTFQVLTKRAERMRDYVSNPRRQADVGYQAGALANAGVVTWASAAKAGDRIDGQWPLPNVWLGVSTERQQEANDRIPDLLATPAAVRFISAEPLLGPINLKRIRIAPDHHTMIDALDGYAIADSISGSGQERTALDWVIVGGESGHGARPMHPQWARDLRIQCAESGVKFFYKQWGEWLPSTELREPWRYPHLTVMPDGRAREDQPDYPDARLVHLDMRVMCRVGKKAAGRLLDGREHNEFPEART